MVPNREPDAGVAHPVERHLAKVEVASSSLVTRSRKKKDIRKDVLLFSMKQLQIQRILPIGQAILHFSQSRLK